MSETQEQNNKLGKKEQTIDIEVKDLEVIERFFSHFDLNTPDYLKSAMTTYSGEQTFDTEKNLKLNLLKAVIENKDKVESLDELFKPVVEACGEMAYNLQFDKDLEDVLSDETTPENPQVSAESVESEQAVESQDS